MSKELAIAQKIRGLKTGKSFQVSTESERQKSLRVAKALKEAGVISFDIVTKERDGGFVVAAI